MECPNCLKTKCICNKALKKKPKVPKGLIFTLILMSFLIGFMVGFYITLNIPIQVMQNYITDFDGTITQTLNNLFSGLG